MPRSVDLVSENRRAYFVPGSIETRRGPAQKIEWRESRAGDGVRVLSGYAAIFNQDYTLYSGDRYELKERIEPTFFDAVIANDPDVFLSIGHDMTKVMGRTKNRNNVSGLILKCDNHGLNVYSRLNPANKHVQALIPDMDDGLIDQMSFAFRVRPSGFRWESVVLSDGKEIDTRILVDCAELIDVCVCARGANSNTEAQLRSYIDSICRAGAEVANPEVAQTTNGTEVANPEVERQLLVLGMQAKMARIKFAREDSNHG